MPFSEVRRADFLMALAYATDLATGHSRDFALRSCVLGMRIADVAKLDGNLRRSIWHQALLRYIGCNADSHLLAAAWGDEIGQSSAPVHSRKRRTAAHWMLTADLREPPVAPRRRVRQERSKPDRR